MSSILTYGTIFPQKCGLSLARVVPDSEPFGNQRREQDGPCTFYPCTTVCPPRVKNRQHRGRPAKVDTAPRFDPDAPGALCAIERAYGFFGFFRPDLRSLRHECSVSLRGRCFGTPSVDARNENGGIMAAVLRSIGSALTRLRQQLPCGAHCEPGTLCRAGLGKISPKWPILALSRWSTIR